MHKSPSPPSLDELLSHMGWVRNLARGLVREEDAEDLAQETMLRAIQTPPKHGENLRGWLAMISRNLTRSTRRKEARRAIRFEEKQPLPIEPPKPEELFARAEMAEKVRDMVDRLDDNAKYLILLRFHEGRKTDEIAQLLGISRRAAQSRLDRAMAKLRGSMRQHLGENYLVACLILASPFGTPIASAVPAGTSAAVTPLVSGSGMAVILKGLLALAALLFPVFFVAFNGGLEPDLDSTTETGIGLATSEPAQEPSAKQERTETVVTPQAPEGSLLNFKVQDSNGLPISTARMAVKKGGDRKPNQLWTSTLDSSRTLISEFEADLDGNIAAELPAGDKCSLYIGSRFHSVERLIITGPDAGLNIDIDPVTLKTAGCIIGDVVDGRGLPVSGAVVLLQRANKTASFLTRNFEHRTVSGADGTYELPSVPFGSYLLQVAHPNFERLISMPFQLDSSHPGVEDVQNLQLSRGLTLTGELEDSEGKPVSGASIWVIDPSELPRGSNLPTPPEDVDVSGESDGNGDFMVYGWSQGRGSALLIEAVGFLTKVIPADQVTDHLQITLQRGLTLAIKVERDKKPITAARVILKQRVDSRNSRSWREDTQANGRALYHGLAPGFYLATVYDERGFGTTQPFELKNGGHEELLSLDPGAGFELLAVNEAGEPIPNVSVYLLRQGGMPDSGESDNLSATNVSSVSGKTDILGKFHMRLNPGMWEIQASKSGRSKFAEKRLLAGNQVVRIVREFGLVGTLEVSALSASGTPLQSLRLGLLPLEGGTIKGNRTDTTGKAFFKNLQAGEYALFPWNQRLAPTIIPADAVTIRIQPGEQTTHSLDAQFVSIPTFRVLSQGKPVPDARLRLEPQRISNAQGFDSRSPSSQRSNENGEWIASPVRAGNYVMIVRGSENQPEQRWDLILEPGIVHHDLHLEEYSVKGRLVDLDGNQLSGIRLELERQIFAPDGSVLEAPNGVNKIAPVNVVSNADGNFEFSAVPSGKWQIRIRDQSWAAPLSSLFVVDSDSTDLGIIKLHAPCTLRLSLSASALHEVEARGGTIPHLTLIHRQSQIRFQLHPNDQGKVVRSDLPAGDFDLLVADRPATPVQLSDEQLTALVVN